MSNQSVPSTSGSSNQQGKTQVFILSPDVLKKLGIANKIPNFPLANTTGKASNSKSTAQIKTDVNLGENIKNKLTSVLNKKNNNSREPTNESKKCDKIEPGTKCDENSVKLKLLSMLTSKSEKEKVKNTSCSVQTIKETHTSNMENQIKPKENITSNLKETKLLQNCNTDENSVTKIVKPEIYVKINEISKHDNKTEINLEKNAHRLPVHKINKPIKNISPNKIIQSNKKTNTKEISETKHPVQSTTILKSISSKESSNKNLKSENENYFSDVKIGDINNAVILNENKDNKTCGINASKHNVGSTMETNEQETTINVLSVDKTPRRGRKRKIIEESPHEDSVRKSARKRKLSTILSDYVTELKLPDESSQKISNKSRKSTDNKNIENPNRSITKDCNDSIKNDSVPLENTASKTENETGKLTKVPEIISSVKITSANTIISKPVSISENTSKEIENKIPFLWLNAPSSSSVCNKSEFTSKNILQSHLKNKISNVVTDEVAQKTQSVADKVSTEIIPDMVKEKSNKISEQKEIYQEIKIKQYTPASSSENVKIISNKNESNNGGQKFVTNLDVGTRKNNVELPNQINPNIPTSPKKQIIIHENILIKPSNENYLNNEAGQSENIEISTEKLSLDKDIDSSLKSENIAVLSKEDTVNDVPINLKMKSPLKTYPGKVRRILSTSAELCAEYTGIQSSSNSEPNQIEKLSSDKHIHSILKTDNTKVLNKEDDVNDSSSDIAFKVKTPLKTYPGKIRGRLSTDAEPLAIYIGGQNLVDTEPNQNKLKSVTCIPIENISSETIVTKISDSPIKTEVHKNIKENQNTEICSLLNIKPNVLKITTCTPESNENISKETLTKKIKSSAERSESIEEKPISDICTPLNCKINELKVTTYIPEPNKNNSEEAIIRNINSPNKLESSENIEEQQNTEICSLSTYKSNEQKDTTYTSEPNKSISEEAVVGEINSSVTTETSENIKEKPNSEICSPLNNKAQSSDNLSEVGLNSSFTAESKTNQCIQELTTKQDLLTYSETTTRNKRSPKQIETIQEPEINISVTETCNSPTATKTKTSVNVNQELLTDSETLTLLTTSVGEQRKPIKEIENVQESKFNITEPDTCDSLISEETKTSGNNNQEILTNSKSSTLLTLIVPEQSKPPKQIQNMKESEVNIPEPETCDSSISTETKTIVNSNQKILTDSESSTLLTIIVPEQIKPAKQIQNLQESEVNISAPEACDLSMSTETKTSGNSNRNILTDSESSAFLIVPEQSKPPKQIENVQESEVNIAEPETCDSPITSNIKTSVNVNQDVLTGSETIVPLKTPNRRQRKPPKQIKIIQESEINKSKPETFDSSIATETKTNVNISQELLTDSKTSSLLTTLVQRQRKPQQKIRNIQESEVDISESETCNSPTATEPKTSVNVKQEVITVSETPSYIKVPTQRKGRPPKKKIEESANLSEPETCNSLIATETKASPNIKQELLTDSESSTLLTTPVRRQRKPPQQIRNTQESEADLSEPETCSSPTVTEPKTNVKQEVIAVSEAISYLKVPMRRRGRPPKIKIEESTDLSEPETLDSSTVKEKLAVTPVGRGRGRGKREVEENSTPGEIIYKKIPGRGRKRNLNEMESNEDPWKFKNGTCAVCNETVASSDWTKHSMKHNFLCWRIGEAAIDMKDKRVVEYVLSKGLKENNKTFKQFTCPQCDDKKKSVLGFIAHMEICQLTEEERMAIMSSCTICDKKVMPQSMKSHMRIHEHSSKNVEVVKNSCEISVNEDTPRTKRKAAAKAVNLIQEVTNQENVVVKKDTGGKRYYKQVKDPLSTFICFGVIKKIQSEFNKGSNKCKFENCNFETDLFDEYKTHLNACPALNADDYICRYCLFVDKDESVIKDHVKYKHIDKENFKDVSGSESDDDANGDNEINSEEETPNPNKPKKIYRPATDYMKPAFRIGFLAKERRIVRNPVCSFLPALRWTREFIRENYSKHLFENIKCLSSKWASVSLSEQEKYMPRWKKSMSVKAYPVTYTIPKLQNKEHMWKEYDLLETNLEDDTVTIFCGGPIWGLAWVPTPINTFYDQYLAVSVQKDFEATYKISETSAGHELIQIWNFGPIESKVTLKSTPTLEFSIAHNHGMVWCMEWCPSGFYDTTNPTDSNVLRRLGLLALACSDGNIPIYAIGIPHKDKTKNHNIFNVKPVIKLVLQEPMDQLLGQWKYQATKLSWSKSSGHNIIAGGYSNGVVCLWDLENTSPLLRSEEKGIIILKPYHSFQAHTTAISALVLYPLIDKGKRWLLTGSWDRTLKYWDVNNTTAPISSYGKRGMITDGVWITHWLCTYSSFDDVFSLGHTVTTVQNPRDFGFRQCSALASNSFVMALSANDWASAVAQGTLAGELTTTFPRAILISYDVDKHLKCKRMMLSYSEIIDKTMNVSERKDIMMTENKSNQGDNEKDEKLFSRYLNDNDKNEPYVEQPSTYEEAREKFGMLFCDFKLAKFQYIPEESLKMVKQSSRLREVPTEMYPFTSLNRVAWNPNKQAYLYVACGYQNGFVRLRCIRFMNTKISDT